MQVAARARDSGNYRQVVVRNTIYLTAAQALTVPLSIIINSVAAQLTLAPRHSATAIW